MHFCSICQNMYYIRLDGEDSNKLIYYCRKCGNEDDTLTTTLDNICVSKTTVKKKEGGVKHLVNEYTKLDPTLPRVSNIPCPNAACISNREHEKKLLVKINFLMKLFICVIMMLNLSLYIYVIYVTLCGKAQKLIKLKKRINK